MNGVIPWRGQGRWSDRRGNRGGAVGGDGGFSREGTSTIQRCLRPLELAFKISSFARWLRCETTQNAHVLRVRSAFTLYRRLAIEQNLKL